ncbi:hypothetical protein NDA13_006296 [Ustilago tritici]|nr:hypothetical protein NDA13_006296 [Ustilago tritici]
MFLTLALSDSVLVLPATDDQLHRQHNVLDAPPQYFASSLGSRRMKYKAQVKAKIRSASTLLSRSLLPAKTNTAEEPLLVVQGSQIEPGAFSKIKYVSADGLGSTCISSSPSPLLLGGSTKVLLSLPDAEAKSRIQKVELSVVQDTRIRPRSGSSSSSTRTHARPYIHLQLPSAQSQQQDFDSSRTKQLERSSDASTLDNKNVLEADFSIQVTLICNQQRCLAPTLLSSSRTVLS